MNPMQAIEAEYAALRAFGYKDGDLGARLIALTILAGQLFPVVVAGVIRAGTSALIVSFLVVYGAMFIVIDLRREKISSSYWSEGWNPKKRERLLVLGFIFATTVIIALLSRFSVVLGSLAYLLTAAFPLHAWVKAKD